jgi:dihydroorotase-like cyclic amidohydrolase
MRHRLEYLIVRALIAIVRVTPAAVPARQVARRKLPVRAALESRIIHPRYAIVLFQKLRHRHRVTPYAGRELFGVVRATYVGGRCVFHDSSLETPSRS